MAKLQGISGEPARQSQLDWKRFYSRALARKFSFLDNGENGSQIDAEEKELRVEVKS